MKGKCKKSKPKSKRKSKPRRPSKIRHNRQNKINHTHKLKPNKKISIRNKNLSQSPLKNSTPR